MRRNVLFLLLLAMITVSAEAQENQVKTEAPQEQVKESPAEENAEEAKTEEEKDLKSNGAKVISGMSILGNQEAPKSLVIVPWKSSRIGESMGISTILDNSRNPVDKEVFLRALRYYEIRSETKP